MTEPIQAHPQENEAPVAAVPDREDASGLSPAQENGAGDNPPAKAPEPQAGHAGAAETAGGAQTLWENMGEADFCHETEPETQARAEMRQPGGELQEAFAEARPDAGVTQASQQNLPETETLLRERQAFQRYLTALPEIQKAKAMQNEAKEMQVRLQMEKEMQEICGMNPNIKNPGDLREMPTYGEMLRLVEKGNSLVEAYKLANFASLTATAAAAESKRLLNRLGETAHLTRTATRQGTAMEAVPAEVLRQYRVFNPNASDAEIQRHYNKEIRKGSELCF